MKIATYSIGSFLVVSSLLAASSVMAQEADADEGMLEEIVVIGSRFAGDVSDSFVPVDIITAEKLEQAAAIGGETNAMLQQLVPSFNFLRQSNTDGADIVRPAQLRGLSPDHVLVLVNGKRRHNSALLNLGAKIGKGSNAPDLNNIPVAAIERIEVLRDGAAAQYGSDAIAGVINIVLKEQTGGGNVSFSWGQHDTTFDPIGQSITDGETFLTSANVGFDVGESGFLNLTLEYRDRDETNRAGFDQVPFFENQTPPNLALVGARNYRPGDPEVEDLNLMYNAGARLASGHDFYSFGSYSTREAQGANFFRYPDSFQNVISVYPNGFIPLTDGEVTDSSLVAGLRGESATGWSWDASLNIGNNEFEYGLVNSINASLGAASPTTFRVADYEYQQIVGNFDVQKSLDLDGRNPLNVAFGLQLRNEDFDTSPGSPESYAAGSFTDKAIGSQGAPGLPPEAAVSESRDAYSAYIDLEHSFNNQFSAGIAGRFEDYDDFGSQFTSKVSGRFEFTDSFAIRAAASTGFRAPSLAQAHFQNAVTNFGDGQELVETRHLRVNDPIARALGAIDLEPEESTNLSIGFVARANNFSLTVDYYDIDVDDRIIVSEQISDPSITQFIEDQFGESGVEAVTFFTNAIDTSTDGFDIVATYNAGLQNGNLDFSVAYNKSDTEVSRVAPTPAELQAFGVDNVLFGVEERNSIVTAPPEDKLILSTNWSNDRWSVLGRATRFGESERVFDFGGGFEPNQIYGEVWAVDFDVSFDINDAFTVSVGGNNIFDEYPDLSTPLINFFDNLPYDILSPIGFNGAYYYARVNYRFQFK